MCAQRRSWPKNAVQEISGRTREAGPGQASQLCWQVSKGVWPRHRQTLLNLNPPPRKQRPLPYAALLGSMLCSCTDTISIFSTNLQHFRPEWLRSKPAVKLPLSWDPRLISPSLIETWQPVPYHRTFGTAQTQPAGRVGWRGKEKMSSVRPYTTTKGV